MEATRGGRTRPWLSPWTMIITPIVRVVMPHEFCHACSFDFCAVSHGLAGTGWEREGRRVIRQDAVPLLWKGNKAMEAWGRRALVGSGSSNTMSNIFEKFWPSECDVAPC